MGYPMTWQRIVGRSGLSQGDYTEVPHGLQVRVNIRDKDDDHASVSAARRERLVQYEQQFKMLCGDLRRLEQDVTDEQAICQHISERAGVDVDTVAAVLKEFMNY